MTPLSVTIITLNEEARLPRCLASLTSIADEIVVVDSGSTDRTIEIAQAAGARVMHNPWSGYGPQKRFAERAATHDFILNIDADEWLTPGAIAEIADLKARDFAGHHFFRFRLPHVYPGADRPRLFADAHVYIRLYDRRRGGFPESLVFDEVTTTEPVREMAGPIWHQSVRDLASFAKKEERYFALQTVEIKATPKRRLKWALRLPFEYPFQFLKYYFGRRHVTGGLFGLQFSHVMASARWKRLVMLLRGRRDAGAKAAGLKT